MQAAINVPALMTTATSAVPDKKAEIVPGPRPVATTIMGVRQKEVAVARSEEIARILAINVDADAEQNGIAPSSRNPVERTNADTVTVRVGDSLIDEFSQEFRSRSELTFSAMDIANAKPMNPALVYVKLNHDPRLDLSDESPICASMYGKATTITAKTNQHVSVPM
jgi:hypothetical protein